MDLPEEITAQLAGMQSALDVLEGLLQPFLDVTPKELDGKLAPLERAQAHLLLAQSVALLFKLHLQLRGQRPEEHPLQKDLERLAQYDKKLRKAAAREQLARSRPTVSLDVAAANRFINAAIPELTGEQKQQLKQLGQAAAQKRAVGEQPVRGGGKQPAAKKQRQQAGGAQAPLSREQEADELLAMALADGDVLASEGKAGAAGEEQRTQEMAPGAPSPVRVAGTPTAGSSAKQRKQNRSKSKRLSGGK